MDRAFALFGKFFLGILIAALLIAGGVYLGIKQNNNKTQSLSPTPTAQVLPKPAITSPQASAIPISSSSANQSVEVIGTDPFSSFFISIPNGWETKKETIVDRARLTLSNGNTSIIISQAAGGGGKCVYPGDTPSDFSNSFNTPTGIMGNSGQFRRATAIQGSVNGDIRIFTVCQLRNSGYQFPTQFGYITYQTILIPSDDTLSKLDQIIASIKIK